MFVGGSRSKFESVSSNPNGDEFSQPLRFRSFRSLDHPPEIYRDQEQDLDQHQRRSNLGYQNTFGSYTSVDHFESAQLHYGGYTPFQPSPYLSMSKLRPPISSYDPYKETARMGRNRFRIHSQYLNKQYNYLNWKGSFSEIRQLPDF